MEWGCRHIAVRQKYTSNNSFNLINPLSRFVLLASLVYAQTAPSPSGADLKVKHMFHGRFAHGYTFCRRARRPWRGLVWFMKEKKRKNYLGFLEWFNIYRIIKWRFKFNAIYFQDRCLYKHQIDGYKKSILKSTMIFVQKL